MKVFNVKQKNLTIFLDGEKHWAEDSFGVVKNKEDLEFVEKFVSVLKQFEANRPRKSYTTHDWVSFKSRYKIFPIILTDKILWSDEKIITETIVEMVLKNNVPGIK